MEIIQEIGSYAGFAAVLGLAVLSALYFSQARDVKRLREWAGRAPERGPSPVVPAEPRGVVAQPIARSAPSRPIPGGTPPPVPRPPGVQPATPGAAAAASAAGAAPAIARGPAPATPAAAGARPDEEDAADEQDLNDDGEQDVTAMDTVVHPPPPPPDDEDGDGEETAAGAVGETDEGFDDAPEDEGDDEQLTGDEQAMEDDALGEETGEYATVAPDETAVYRPGDTGEADELEDDDPGTGEWRPEDEHADIDFTDEHDVVPATPAASAPRPPVPPRPYQRRGAPAPATGYARDRGGILPPYAESRPDSEDEEPSGGSGRRPILLVVAAMVAIAVVAFGVLQLTGGDDSSDGGGSDAGLATGGSTDGSGGSGDGDSAAPPIDPSQVTVAVLNGTTVPGLAATVGDKIVGEGFQLGTVTNNFDQERAESVVLYAPGAEREAADVGRRLDISQREAIDAESQALAGDATVVVVTGADQNQ
jgi:LytR cell envelope-related transcriptional attenuator